MSCVSLKLLALHTPPPQKKKKEKQTNKQAWQLSRIQEWKLSARMYFVPFLFIFLLILFTYLSYYFWLGLQELNWKDSENQ